MLHPGTCSASRSDTNTWVGPPGALATHSAIQLEFGGNTLGPPTAANGPLAKVAARCDSQSGSAIASSSMYAMISPVAAFMPVLRAAARPRCAVSMTRTPSKELAIWAESSVEPSQTKITS